MSVRAELEKALETMEPILKSFDNWCRVDHHGQCQSHLIDKPCSVMIARRAFTAALARTRREPECGDGCTDRCPCFQAGIKEGVRP